MEQSDPPRIIEIIPNTHPLFESAIKISSSIWCLSAGNNREVPLYPNIPEFDDILEQAIKATQTEGSFIILIKQPRGSYTGSTYDTQQSDPKDFIPIASVVLSCGIPPHKSHWKEYPKISAVKNPYYLGRLATLENYSGQGAAKALLETAVREISSRGGSNLLLSRRSRNEGNGTIFEDGLAGYYEKKFGQPVLEIPVLKYIDNHRGLIEAIYLYSLENQTTQ